MPDYRFRVRGWTAPALLALGTTIVAFAPGGGQSRADRITLRGGGLIRGKVLADPQHPNRVTVLTETGKTPLSFQKAQVVEVKAEPSILDEYLQRRDALTSTAVANYELGVWCEDHKLKDLADLHFEAAVKHDRAYAPAHQKLGHVQMGDDWLWGDELREAQGLVRYKGRWISKQEKDHRAAAAASSAEQASWVRRLKVLRQALVYGPEERRRDAQQQLMEIRDPIAVTPLLQVLGEEDETLRALLDHVLSLIPGPEAAAALVKHIVHEPDFDVRHVTMDALMKRKEPNVVPGLVQKLGSEDPAVVNRAAWTLGQLNAVRTVPKLIPALVTTQSRLVLPSIPGVTTGGNMGASFGSVAPASGMGGNYFNNGGSFGLLTPPVVGPSVAAFGGTAVPTPTLPGLSTGSPPRSQQEPRIVTLGFQNVEVLATLVKLSGQDFGFDIPAWQRWVSTGFRPDPTPVRRVPQP